MKSLVLRVLGTLLTLFSASAIGKFLATGALLTMNSVAVDQLRDSDSAYMQFSMLDWFMSSPWGAVEFVVVCFVLFFIWKGQFKNAK
jgi:hypothetical protein